MKKQNRYMTWGLSTVIVVGIIVGSIFMFYQRTGNEVKLPSAQESTQQTDQESVELEEKEDIPAVDSEKEDELERESLRLFTADSETYTKKESETVEIEGSMDIKEKLERIAQGLSELYFDHLPIEIKEIEEIQGKKIAVINLKEDTAASDGDKTWMQYLNAGSAGSQITLVTLEESFLQRDLKEEWIDGIKIIYEDGDLEEMDHFPGTQIIYR